MACYLRAYGAQFDVDAFVRVSPFEWLDIWRVGEARVTPLGKDPRLYETSGLQAKIAAREDLPSQRNEASAFLTNHRDEVSRLSSTPGIESLVIDFGLAWDPSLAARYVGLPPELL